MVRIWKEGKGNRKKGPYENLQLSYADTNLLQRLSQADKRVKKKKLPSKKESNNVGESA
jgi:hypothetical protein